MFSKFEKASLLFFFLILDFFEHVNVFENNTVVLDKVFVLI